MEVPKPLSNIGRGPKRKYRFHEMEVGLLEGHHVPCRVKERDSLWGSIRTLCAKHSKEGDKVFKCYPTETGVFYWREA